MKHIPALRPPIYDKSVKFWVSVDSAFTAIVNTLATHEKVSGEDSLFGNFCFYAFRVPYGHEQLVATAINSEAETILAQLREAPALDTTLLQRLAIAYIPTRQKRPAKGKKPAPADDELESLVPNLMFVLTTFDKAEEISMTPLRKESGKPSAPTIMRAYYMRDHTKERVNGKYPPITIPPRAMWSFIRLTSTHNPDVELLPPDFPIVKGALYKVIAGRFAGVIGHAQRVKGKDVVLVDLNTLGFVKSCFISKKLLVPVDDATDITYVPRPEEEEHLTSRNIHRLPQPQDDPRRWYVLKTWHGRQHEVAATITYRQHLIIEARKQNTPLPHDAYYGIGEWPVIAIALYSRKAPQGSHRPPNHLYLYATPEDAYALVNRPFPRDVAPDFPGERTLPLRFKMRPNPDTPTKEVPIELPYPTMQNLLRLTRNVPEGIYKFAKDQLPEEPLPNIRLTSGPAKGVQGHLLKLPTHNTLLIPLLPTTLIAYDLPEATTYEVIEEEKSVPMVAQS